MGLFRKRARATGDAGRYREPLIGVYTDAVVCEPCGTKLDIAGAEAGCQTCGAPLSFPVGSSGIERPYCHSGVHRL